MSRRLAVSALGNRRRATPVHPGGEASRRRLERFCASALAMIAGWNILVTEIHPVTDTSGDLGLDFELTGNVLLPGPPALAVSRAGGALTLTWLEWASFFGVFATTNLAPPAAWLRLANTPALSNDLWVSPKVYPTNFQRLFRLQSP